MSTRNCAASARSPLRPQMDNAIATAITLMSRLSLAFSDAPLSFLTERMPYGLFVPDISEPS
jgi:hypothetical protein